MPEPKLDDMAETEPTTAEAETENGMDLATDNVIREAMQVRAEIIESRAAHKRASAEPDAADAPAFGAVAAAEASEPAAAKEEPEAAAEPEFAEPAPVKWTPCSFAVGARMTQEEPALVEGPATTTTAGAAEAATSAGEEPAVIEHGAVEVAAVEEVAPRVVSLELSVAADGAVCLTIAPRGAPTSEPALIGTLTKRGTCFPWAWQERTFMFDAASRTLAYYRSQADAEHGRRARGSLQLKGVRTASECEPLGLVFEGQGKEILARADSNESRQSLLRLLGSSAACAA